MSYYKRVTAQNMTVDEVVEIITQRLKEAAKSCSWGKLVFTVELKSGGIKELAIGKEETIRKIEP